MPPVRTLPVERLRPVAWLAILVAAIFLGSAGGTYPGIAFPPFQIAIQVLAYAILGTWLVGALARPSWRPNTPLALPVALAALAYTLSGFFSQRPRLSLEPTLAGLGFALAFLFLTRLLADGWFRSRVGAFLVLGVAIVVVGYVLQVAIEWIRWWGLVGGFAVPPLRPSFAGFVFGSPNLVATFLLLTGPLAVVLALQRSGRLAVALALAIAAFIAFFLTGSRGGYLGFGVALVLALALLISTAEFRAQLFRGREILGARPILAAPIVIAAIAVLVLIPAVVGRFAQGGESLRLDLWRSALTIFNQHPVLGAGPGTWVLVKVAASPPGVPNILVPHAHNMYVQSAAELGLVGLAAQLFLVGAVCLRLLSAMQTPGRIRLQAGAVAIGLAGFAGQSLVDNLVNLPAICLLVLLLVAWIDSDPSLAGSPSGEAFAHPTWRGRPGRMLPALALLAMVVVAPTLAVIDAAAIRDLDGNHAALDGDWATASDNYTSAVGIDPDFTLYALQRGSALARLNRIEEARSVLTRAAPTDGVAVNLIGLAYLDLESGDGPAALEHARAAVDRGPGEAVVALNAGLIGEAVGDHSYALDRLADALVADPALGRAAVWAHLSGSITLDEVVALARRRTDPLTASLIVAYAGDPVTAQSALDGQPPSEQRDIYLAVAAALAGDTAGRRSLEAILRANPRDWLAAAWLARICRDAGDLPAADRYGDWATIVQADAAPSVIIEASVAPVGDEDATAGLPANYPWAVYLRPVSPYLLPPEVVRIGTR